jgi:uncharacterized membrane protein
VIRNVWAVVALVGMALGAIVALLAIRPGDPTTQAAVMAILAILGPMVGAAHISGRVDEVKHLVNGNLTRLIEAKTQLENRSTDTDGKVG